MFYWLCRDIFLKSKLCTHSAAFRILHINKTINNILINRGAHTSDSHKLNMLNLFCIICTIIKWNSMRLLHCHSVLNTWLEQKRFPTAWFGFESLFVLSPLIYDREVCNMSEKWGKICLSISPKCHQVLCKCRLFLHKSISHFILLFFSTDPLLLLSGACRKRKVNEESLKPSRCQQKSYFVIEHSVNSFKRVLWKKKSNIN